jgi:hypothetical protein
MVVAAMEAVAVVVVAAEVADAFGQRLGDGTAGAQRRRVTKSNTKNFANCESLPA